MTDWQQITPLRDGDWSRWVIWPRRFIHGCCDCDLAHDVEMRLDKKGNIWMRWRTNPQETKAARSRLKRWLMAMSSML